MESQEKHTITIQTTVEAPIEKVWEFWTIPDYIIHWNAASDDWHTPRAENDLRVGGLFTFRMEAKDRSMGFDFEGIYDVVENQKRIEYTLGDGRKVVTLFNSKNHRTEIIQMFEAESTNSVALQRSGWQAILDNFKHFAETNKEVLSNDQI